MLVGHLERVRHVVRDGKCLADRESARFSREAVTQGLTLHVRHDVVQQSPGLACGVDRDDVWVCQGGGKIHFAQEAFASQPRRNFRCEHLDGDLALRTAFPGEEDRGHSAPTQDPLEGVAARERGLESLLEIVHGALSQTATS